MAIFAILGPASFFFGAVCAESHMSVVMAARPKRGQAVAAAPAMIAASRTASSPHAIEIEHDGAGLRHWAAARSLGRLAHSARVVFRYHRHHGAVA